VKAVKAPEGVLVDLSSLFIISYLRNNDVTIDNNNNQRLRYQKIGAAPEYTYTPYGAYTTYTTFTV
jgi:hypothetical protein